MPMEDVFSRRAQARAHVALQEVGGTCCCIAAAGWGDGGSHVLPCAARPPPRLTLLFPPSPPSLGCLQGRGTVVTGRVEQGIVRTGDEVEIVGIRPTNTKSIVTGERVRQLAGDRGLHACLPGWAASAKGRQVKDTAAGAAAMQLLKNRRVSHLIFRLYVASACVSLFYLCRRGDV
jgi:hypothetical protein